jgi:hypothetical protein
LAVLVVTEPLCCPALARPWLWFTKLAADCGEVVHTAQGFGVVVA